MLESAFTNQRRERVLSGRKHVGPSGGKGCVGRGRECIRGESVVAYQGGGEGRGRECIRGRACWPTRGRVCDRRACLLIRGGWRERIGEESLKAHQGVGFGMEVGVGRDISGR